MECMDLRVEELVPFYFLLEAQRRPYHEGALSLYYPPSTLYRCGKSYAIVVPNWTLELHGVVLSFEAVCIFDNIRRYSSTPLSLSLHSLLALFPRSTLVPHLYLLYLLLKPYPLSNQPSSLCF